MPRSVLLLCAAVILGGCRFWYKPVPVDNPIGEEETVIAGDSVNVYRTERFEVYGPNPEAVYDGYEQLNRAYRTFERYFGAPAPRLAFILYADSVPTLADATLRTFRDRGYTPVQYKRPRGVRTRSRYGALDYGGILWPIAPTAARHLLARMAATELGAAAPASDTAVLDRFPLWFRAAVIHTVGEAVSSNSDLETVRDKRDVLIPLRDVLTLVRPSSADSLLDPTRRADVDEYTRTFAAQASMLARYLVEREGPAVMSRFARGYLAQRSLAEMIGELRATTKTIPELEARWRVWIDTRE